jgi:hypothetical protein
VVSSRGAATLAVLAVAVAGCNSKNKSEPAPAPSDDAALRRVDVAPERLPVAIVLSERVIDPGQLPRREHRYRADRPGRYQLATKTAITERIDGVENTEALPRVVRSLELSAGGPDGERLVIEFSGRPSETPEPATATNRLDRYRALVAGRSGTLELDRRGLLTDVTISGGAQIAESRKQIAALLSDGVAVFPRQAIGPGARWRVVLSVPRAGVYAKHTTDYELVEARDERVVIKFERSIIGERQPIDSTEAARAANAELVALSISSEGTFEIDPAQLAPIHGTFSALQRLHGRMDGKDYYIENRSRHQVGAPPP